MSKETDEKSNQVISDYNGYDYKKIFWEDADRKYEDMADRIAIRSLLPKKMENFADIAGGYGRLAKEYLKRAKKATLFDYSKTELEQAKELYGDKLHTKAGDIYHLPFDDENFDALMMVRATHHFKDMRAVSAELFRVLKPKGIAVIEVANKRTLPRIFRYIFGRTKTNPFNKATVNLTDIDPNGFFNYHPQYIEDVFRDAGFRIKKIRSVSNFRSPGLKKFFGNKFLTKLEKPAQVLLAPIRFAPSIYYQLEKPLD